jgi:hypothetical protein
MATRGFEFAFRLDGASATPVIRDFPVDGTGAYAIGDLCLLNSDGQMARVTSTTTEVSGVCMEARASGSDGASLKFAVLVREQVWRCSMDASSTSFVVGYTKTIDTVDHNTISASDSTGGGMILVDASELDDVGNVLAYVVFADTTFGNT